MTRVAQRWRFFEPGTLRLLSSSGAALLVACSGAGETPPTSGPPPSSTVGPATGVIEGVVHLVDGEAMPAFETSPFTAEGARPLPHECTPPRVVDRQPLGLGEARGLSNVAVTATGDASHWPAPGEPVTHTVRIHDCRLTPAVVVATVGDHLAIENELTYPFMPDLGLGMLEAVLPTDPLDIELDQAGPRQLRCSFTAPCGRADILVFHHPVHALTTEGGHFRIENAPADQDLSIVAWHPLLRDATVRVRVRAGETTHVDIPIRLAPPFHPPPVSMPPVVSVDPIQSGGVEPPPSTTVPPATIPPMTVSPTTVPPTTVPPTTSPPG
jgi:hypothetical protein